MFIKNEKAKEILNGIFNNEFNVLIKEVYENTKYENFEYFENFNNKIDILKKTSGETKKYFLDSLFDWNIIENLSNNLYYPNDFKDKKIIIKDWGVQTEQVPAFLVLLSTLNDDDTSYIINEYSNIIKIDKINKYLDKIIIKLIKEKKYKTLHALSKIYSINNYLTNSEIMIKNEQNEDVFLNDYIKERAFSNFKLINIYSNLFSLYINYDFYTEWIIKNKNNEKQLNSFILKILKKLDNYNQELIIETLISKDDENLNLTKKILKLIYNEENIIKINFEKKHNILKEYYIKNPNYLFVDVKDNNIDIFKNEKDSIFFEYLFNNYKFKEILEGNLKDLVTKTEYIAELTNIKINKKEYLTKYNLKSINNDDNNDKINLFQMITRNIDSINKEYINFKIENINSLKNINDEYKDKKYMDLNDEEKLEIVNDILKKTYFSNCILSSYSKKEYKSPLSLMSSIYECFSSPIHIINEHLTLLEKLNAENIFLDKYKDCIIHIIKSNYYSILDSKSIPFIEKIINSIKNENWNDIGNELKNTKIENLTNQQKELHNKYMMMFLTKEISPNEKQLKIKKI